MELVLSCYHAGFIKHPQEFISKNQCLTEYQNMYSFKNYTCNIYIEHLLYISKNCLKLSRLITRPTFIQNSSLIFKVSFLYTIRMRSFGLDSNIFQLAEDLPLKILNLFFFFNHFGEISFRNVLQTYCLLKHII